MPEIVLFPRLGSGGVRALLENPQVLTSGSLNQLMREVDAYVSWAGSGGRRVRVDELEAFRAEVVAIATECSFPEQGSQAARADFDARCAAWLADQELLPECEALRDDVWAFLTSCLLPDVSFWRFPEVGPQRLQGGVRNTFQRLWLRARAFDRGVDHSARWELLQALTEDAMVQITERPTLGAHAPLARQIAEVWLETAQNVGRARMEPVTRAAMKEILEANEILYLAALPPEALRLRLGSAFRHHAAPEEGAAA